MDPWCEGYEARFGERSRYGSKNHWQNRRDNYRLLRIRWLQHNASGRNRSTAIGADKKGPQQDPASEILEDFSVSCLRANRLIGKQRSPDLRRTGSGNV